MELAVTKEKTRNRFYNPNPVNRTNASDCVVRAFCKATGREWKTIYMELVEIGLEIGGMPNGDETWKEWIKRNPFIKHSIKIVKGSKRPTVAQFAKEHKKGTFILNVANHLVTVVDGRYYDTWDCGHKCLYGFYELAE
jgi:hypothetical protein